MKSRPRPTPEQLARYAAGFNATRTLQLFGVMLDYPDGETCRVTMPVRNDHLGGLGSDAVNGGILAAVFDLAIGCTGALVDPTRRTATLQLSMNFERPLRGPVLIARGRLDRVGGRTAFSSAVIEDEIGEACARAQGVLRLTDVPWAAGDHPGMN